MTESGDMDFPLLGRFQDSNALTGGYCRTVQCDLHSSDSNQLRVKMMEDYPRILLK